MKETNPIIKTVIAVALSFSTVAIAAPSEQRPVLPIFGAEEIQSQCQTSIDDLNQRMSELESIAVETEEGSAEFLAGWNRLQIAIENIDGPMGLLGEVSPDPEVRKNADACSRNVRRFVTDLYQNNKLYRNMRLLRVNDDEQRKLRQDNVSAYEDAGVSLMPDKRKRVKQILERLTEIEQKFSKNIRDNRTKLVFKPEELQGLPQEYIDKARKDEKGNYLLGFSYPEYVPFMQYADSDQAREDYRNAFINRGTQENIALLQEAVKLRYEMAVLSGYRSYADYALRRRMAKKPAVVTDFLNNIQKLTTQTEKAELNELRELKAAERQTPIAKTQIKHWDTSYWMQKLKQKRYNIDSNALRPYFPTQGSMEWAMGMAGEMYGLHFKPARVPVWHDDVRYYDVIDNKTNKQIGGIYLDIYPREGKYGHAAAFPVQGSSTLEHRLPMAVLVANFNQEGLDLDELETLLHEFGHVMHGVVSKTKYVEQSGTSVERDFVEAPSQMFEEWAHHYETLSLIPEFSDKRCPKITRDLLKRLNDSRRFGKGIVYARQALYAQYDMAIYGGRPSNVMTVWKNMEAATPQGYDKGTEFPGQFAHVVGGYAAGYYSYLWSKVLAMDMFSKFKGHMLDPKVGGLYRTSILEKGSELPADRLVHYFLRRSPDSTAFYEDISGLERSR